MIVIYVHIEQLHTVNSTENVRHRTIWKQTIVQKLVLRNRSQCEPAGTNLAVHSGRTDGKTVTGSRMDEFYGDEAAFSGSHLMAALCQ